MFLILKIILLICYFHSAISESGIDLKDIKWESLRAITDLGQELKSSNEKDVLNIVDAVVKLGEMIPYLGPFCTLASSIIGIFKGGQIDPHLKQMSDLLENHMFKIENKLDQLANLITDTAIGSNIKSHQEHIHNLNDLSNRFIENPNNISKKAFIDECEKNNMILLAKFFDREISTETNLSIKQFMLNDYDMKKFGTWSKALVSALSQAMVLHTLCLATQYPDDSTRNLTIENDQGTFKKIAKNLENFIRSGDNEIKMNFMNKASPEIDGLFNSNKGMDHKKFLELVYSSLKEKYYWRKWMVCAYEGLSEDLVKHFVSSKNDSPYVHNLVDPDHMISFVTSTNNLEPIAGKLQKCINKFREAANNKEIWYTWEIAKDIYRDITHCLPVNGMGVIKHGNKLDCTYDDSVTAFMIDVVLNWDTYSVFAISKELNNSVFNEEHNRRTHRCICEKNCPQTPPNKIIKRAHKKESAQNSAAELNNKYGTQLSLIFILSVIAIYIYY